jgi:hypothetical protein
LGNPSETKSPKTKLPPWVPNFQPLTVEVDFDHFGYGTTEEHGHSIDMRLYKPIPKRAEISSGESWRVYISKNKKALVLVRARELDTPEKVQSILTEFHAGHFLTPALITRTVRQARRAMRASLPKSKIKLLHHDKKKRPSR